MLRTWIIIKKKKFFYPTKLQLLKKESTPRLAHLVSILYYPRRNNWQDVDALDFKHPPPFPEIMVLGRRRSHNVVWLKTHIVIHQRMNDFHNDFDNGLIFWPIPITFFFLPNLRLVTKHKKFMKNDPKITKFKRFIYYPDQHFFLTMKRDEQNRDSRQP